VWARRWSNRMNSEIVELAQLIRKRNEIDEEISRRIGRPANIGHIGEFIAAAIFDIELFASATTKAADGVFQKGQLQGKTVNVKFYGKQESSLDIRRDALPDFYLVLTGPKSACISSKGKSRPVCISAVYLFDAPLLVDAIQGRGSKFSEATSVPQAFWQAAELWPTARNPVIVLEQKESDSLQLFAS